MTTSPALDSHLNTTELAAGPDVAQRNTPRASFDATMSTDSTSDKAPTLVGADAELGLATLDPSKEEKELQEAPVPNAEAPPPPAHDFPDGGSRAYLTTLGGSMVLFSTFGTSNSWGAIQAHLLRNQLSEYSPSSVAWIGSGHLCVVFLLGLPTGRLFDRGYFNYMLAGGSVLWIFGVFMLSLSTEFYQIFLSYTVAMGLGLGLVFTAVVSCVGSYFLKKRATMTGCSAGGAALGAVVLPIMMNRLFPMIGWGNTIRATGYLQAGLLALANVLMRPRKLPPKAAVPVFPLIRSFLKQPSTWFACLGCGCIMLGMFIPIFFIQSFAEAHNASPVVVNYCVAILNAGAVVSRLGIGLVCDRWGVYNVAVPVTAVIGGLVFAMLGATSTGAAVAFCVIFGLASGSWVTLQVPALISLATDVREIGVRVGLGFIFVAVSTLVGSPIAGALLTRFDGYLAPCLFGGCVTLLGTFFLTLARQTQLKRRKHWKV